MRSWSTPPSGIILDVVHVSNILPTSIAIPNYINIKDVASICRLYSMSAVFNFLSRIDFPRVHQPWFQMIIYNPHFTALIVLC